MSGAPIVSISCFITRDINNREDQKYHKYSDKYAEIPLSSIIIREKGK